MQAHSQATLRDVAEAADVSVATASRALNGMRVTPHLAERVLQAAEQLAYAPNAHARALVGAGHRTVGVICHDISDPYFATIAGGVMRVARDNDLLVMLADTFHDPEREVAYVSMLRAERARAILLVGSGYQDPHRERALEAELKPYLDGGGRVTAVSRHRNLRVDTVLPENRAGAAALARALLDMGHRRFAILTGPRALTTVADRLGGFRDELTKSGVPLAAADIVEGTFTRDGGYAAMTQLLTRGLPATCVFAVTDVMAIGACAAAREHGLSVPDDVSIAGFDDIPIVRDLTPPLTTVALPLQQLGERAMQLALTDNPRPRRRILRMGGEVVIRASTAKLA